MKYLVMLWHWLNTSHCFCGCTRKICHAHERRHRDGQGNDACAYCDHLKPCHPPTA